MAVGYAPRLPLEVDSIDGAYTLIKNRKTLIRQNLKMLILTAPGERMMTPRYGVGLRRYLFEPDTVDIRQELKSAIMEQAQIYMPEIKIEKIFMLTRDQIPDMVDNAMQLRIVYTVPLMRELAFLDIDVATMDV